MSTFKSLLSFLVYQPGRPWRDRGVVAAIVVLGTAGGATSVAILALISRELASPRVSAGAALTFAGLAVLLATARFGSQAMLAWLVQGHTARLRVHLARQILSTPLRDLEAVGPSRLLAALTDDVFAISLALNAAPTLILQASLTLCCLGYLVAMSWRLALVLILVLCIGVFSYRLPKAAARRHVVASRASLDQLFAHFQALTGGVKELQMCRERRDEFLGELLVPTTERARHHWTRAIAIHAATAASAQLSMFLLVALVLVGIPAWTTVDRYVITGFVLTLLYMMGPLESLVVQLPNVERAGAAARNLEMLGLSLASAPDDPPPAGAREWRTIELRDVVYQAVDGNGEGFCCGPLNLTFTPGQVTLITGTNGSGKTTAIKLLTGLYAPQHGDLRRDGVVIDTAGRADYRQLFSVVFADFHLFLQLIGLPREGLVERGDELLQRMRLNGRVSVQGHAWSTLALSQGQRRRLALATAWLEDRPILVLDEWSSDQDTFFKTLFFERLLPELRSRGKTVLIVGPDEHHYAWADRIVRLEGGRVQFDGTSDEYRRWMRETVVPADAEAVGAAQIAGLGSA